MSKNYILEIGDETQLILEIGVNSTGATVITTHHASYLTPYTEPRKESCDKCMNEVEDLAYQLYSVKVDEAYQRGLNGAWEAARKIAKLNTDEQKRLFGCFGIYFIAHEFSASEAIEKIRQYEQEQEDAEFHVGDEFVTKNNKDIGVIVAANAKRVLVLWKDDADIVDENNREFTTKWAKERFAKTGRNFPEIAEVFKKMKGEE